MRKPGSSARGISSKQRRALATVGDVSTAGVEAATAPGRVPALEDVSFCGLRTRAVI